MRTALFHTIDGKKADFTETIELTRLRLGMFRHHG
jgi:hypothetical protein